MHADRSVTRSGSDRCVCRGRYRVGLDRLEGVSYVYYKSAEYVEKREYEANCAKGDDAGGKKKYYEWSFRTRANELQ